MKTRSILRKKDTSWQLPFFVIWTGQTFSLVGSQLVGFAFVWYLTDLTGSAKVLALAATMEWLPRVLIGPFAGAVVDRWNRRSVMLVADSVTALATAMIIYLSWVGDITLWHIYLLMMVRSIGSSFHYPAMQATTSLMVPEDSLTRLQGLNQLLQGAMNIIAPILGAILIASMPIYGVLGIDVITAVIAILSLLLIQVPQPERAQNTERGSSMILKEMQDGFRYVWDWIGLRKVLGLAVVINFLSMPALILMPIFVKTHFQGGAGEVAGMQSAWSIGFLLGALLLSTWGGFKRKIITATIAIFGSGIAMVVVGISPAAAYSQAVGGFVIAGLMNVFMNGPTLAMLQTVVDKDKQGRVFALVISLANVTTPLGLAVAGPIAEVAGVQTWFIFAAAAFLLAGVFATIDRDVRHIEEGNHTTQLNRDTTPAIQGTAS